MGTEKGGLNRGLNALYVKVTTSESYQDDTRSFTKALCVSIVHCLNVGGVNSRLKYFENTQRGNYTA